MQDDDIRATAINIYRQYTRDPGNWSLVDLIADALIAERLAGKLEERTRCALIARADWERHNLTAGQWQKDNNAYSNRHIAKAHAKASAALHILKVIQKGFDARLEREQVQAERNCTVSEQKQPTPADTNVNENGSNLGSEHEQHGP